jgi:hypothetical protein
VESSQVVERAVATATMLAAIPREAFAQTKQQVVAPVLAKVRESARSDEKMRALWSAPETLEAIGAYVRRTFKRPGS